MNGIGYVQIPQASVTPALLKEAGKMGKVLSISEGKVEVLVGDQIVKIEAHQLGRLKPGDMIQVYFEGELNPQQKSQIPDQWRARLLDIISLSFPMKVSSNMEQMIQGMSDTEKIQVYKATSEILNIVREFVAQHLSDTVTQTQENLKNVGDLMDNSLPFGRRILELAFRAKAMGASWDQMPKAIKEAMVQQFVFYDQKWVTRKEDAIERIPLPELPKKITIQSPVLVRPFSETTSDSIPVKTPIVQSTPTPAPLPEMDSFAPQLRMLQRLVNPHALPETPAIPQSLSESQKAPATSPETPSIQHNQVDEPASQHTKTSSSPSENQSVSQPSLARQNSHTLPQMTNTSQEDSRIQRDQSPPERLRTIPETIQRMMGKLNAVRPESYRATMQSPDLQPQNASKMSKQPTINHTHSNHTSEAQERANLPKGSIQHWMQQRVLQSSGYAIPTQQQSAANLGQGDINRWVDTFVKLLKEGLSEPAQLKKWAMNWHSRFQPEMEVMDSKHPPHSWEDRILSLLSSRSTGRDESKWINSLKSPLSPSAISPSFSQMPVMESAIDQIIQQWKADGLDSHIADRIGKEWHTILKESVRLSDFQPVFLQKAAVLLMERLSSDLSGPPASKARIISDIEQWLQKWAPTKEQKAENPTPFHGSTKTSPSEESKTLLERGISRNESPQSSSVQRELPAGVIDRHQQDPGVKPMTGSIQNPEAQMDDIKGKMPEKDPLHPSQLHSSDSAPVRDRAESQQVSSMQFLRLMNFSAQTDTATLYTAAFAMESFQCRIDWVDKKQYKEGYDTKKTYRIMIDVQTGQLGEVLIDTFFRNHQMELFLYAEPEHQHTFTQHSSTLYQRLRSEGFEVRGIFIRDIPTPDQLLEKRVQILTGMDGRFNGMG